MPLTRDILPKALDRIQPIIEAGEIALPTITIDVGAGPLTMIVAAEAADMEPAFRQARQIMIFKGAKTFLITGQTAEPEGLYAALVSAQAGAGLFRGITRTPELTFAPDATMPLESLAPMIEIAPATSESLDAETTKKIRSVLSLHSQLEPGAPLVIRP